MFLKRFLKTSPLGKILVVSLQKCGTYLIQKVMEGAGLKGVGVGEGCKMSHFLELKEYQYLWSHFTPSDEILMALEKGNDSVRIVFNFRDPRDALVSWFYWMHPESENVMHLNHAYMKKVYKNFTDAELMDIFIKIDKFRKSEYNPIEHFRLSRVLLFHPGVLNVRFEDLVGSRGGGCDGRQLNNIRDIYDYLNIRGINLNRSAEKIFDTGSPTFRKGVIGTYKEVLSSGQITLFNRLHGDVIRQYGYEE